MTTLRFGFVTMAMATAALAAGPVRGADAVPEPVRVVPLLTQALPDLPAKEVEMLTVEYLPGGASLPHRHDAHVFVYVLEGTLRMQVAGKAVETLGPGAVFYEGPGDVHQTSANASATRPAKFLVVVLKDKGRPLSRPATAQAAQ
jgi:quercetin dioxygenase-like cupin family protein